MLRLSSGFLNRNILSLRIGGVIGTATEPIINPNNLKVEGWYVQSSHVDGKAVPPTIEIRDLIAKGFVVDDYSALTHPDDLIRLQETMSIHYALIGKQVITDTKRKLGKITDYAVDDSYFIQKLYVSPTLLKSFSSEQQVIDRQSIIEISDNYIIIRDSTDRVSAGVQAAAQA